MYLVLWFTDENQRSTEVHQAKLDNCIIVPTDYIQSTGDTLLLISIINRTLIQAFLGRRLQAARFAHAPSCLFQGMFDLFQFTCFPIIFSFCHHRPRSSHIARFRFSPAWAVVARFFAMSFFLLLAVYPGFGFGFLHSIIVTFQRHALDEEHREEQSDYRTWDHEPETSSDAVCCDQIPSTCSRKATYHKPL